MRVEVGATLPPRRIGFVSPETMKVWAPILRDPNPIHLDRAAVMAKGLGERRINQGPINVAYCVDMLLAGFPGCRIESIASRFVDNVYEGDAVTATGVVTGISDRGAEQAVAVDFELRAEGRSVAIAGKATLVLPAEARARLSPDR